MFQSEDASNNIVVDTEMKSIAPQLDREKLPFFEKIEAFVGRNDELEYRFVDRTAENNTSPSSREITIEFLDSRNEEKFDRLVRDDTLSVSPFKRLSASNSPSNSSIVGMEYEHEISSAAGSSSTINQYDRQEGTTVGHSPTITAAAHMESVYRFGGGDVTAAAIINEVEDIIMNSSTTAANIDHIKNRRYNVELENRPEVLARRQKQIDYGKNTIGYDNYIKVIPKNKRSKDHPRTPPKEVKYSRRAFDGLVKIWRTNLHRFDPPDETSDSHGAGDTN